MKNGPLPLETIVAVRMEQRIPPEEGGDWKDLGIKLLGRLSNGGQVQVGETDEGGPVYKSYVMPVRPMEHDMRHGNYGNTHPRLFVDGKVDRLEYDGGRHDEYVRYFVEQAGYELVKLAVEMETRPADNK